MWRVIAWVLGGVVAAGPIACYRVVLDAGAGSSSGATTIIDVITADAKARDAGMAASAQAPDAGMEAPDAGQSASTERTDAGQAENVSPQSLASLRAALSQKADAVDKLASKDPNRWKRVASVLRTLSAQQNLGADVNSCDTYAFKPNETFDQDKVFFCTKSIIFGDGVTVRVAQGKVLLLAAPEIVINGSARIDGAGEQGAAGLPGESRKEWTSHGAGDYWAARDSCDSNPSNIGGQGQQGGDGGSGAIIILQSVPVGGSLDVSVRGGDGGPGGLGGKGTHLKNGLDNGCDSCEYDCRSGPQGPTGPKGLDGAVIVLQ